MTCPLCSASGHVFYDKTPRLFYECANCFGIFIDRKELLGKEAEKLRYDNHQNDPHDLRYQKFVSPIVSSITKKFTAQHRGLDFGSGNGSAISKLLRDQLFQIEAYDPFFLNFPELLEKKYDFIACCEVIEHFHNPHKEFVLLKNLLLPGGRLYCMTSIYNETIDFDGWYYKNDPTHVFIYHDRTLNWIKTEFEFSQVQIAGKLITYSY